MKGPRLSFRGLVVQYLRQRDGNNCGICKEPLYGRIQVDHIVPLAREGADDISNVQLSHRECNSLKKDRVPGLKPNGGRLAEEMKALIERRIVEALVASKGHQKHAAELVGLSYRSFRHLAERHKVDLHCGDVAVE